MSIRHVLSPNCAPGPTATAPLLSAVLRRTSLAPRARLAALAGLAPPAMREAKGSRRPSRLPWQAEQPASRILRDRHVCPPGILKRLRPLGASLLIDRLLTGAVAGAFLDVFERETLVVPGPLSTGERLDLTA